MSLQLEHDAQVPIQTHIDEFSSRFSILIFIWVVASIIWMFNVNSILDLVLRTLEPCDDGCSNLYDPAKWSEIRWLTGAFLGFITIMPLLVYHFIIFAKPGLMKREVRWLITWLILGTIGFIANVILTVFVIMPSLFEIGHYNQTELGFVAKYDVSTMLSMAIGIIWSEVLIILGAMAMIIAGITGLMHKDNSNWWRLRVHGLIIMLILLSFYGNVSFSIFLIIFSFTSIEVITFPWTRASATMKLSAPEVFDEFGNSRKILFAQCECSNEYFLPSNFDMNQAFYSFKALCENNQDRELLYELISLNRFSDVLVLGCSFERSIRGLENNIFSYKCQLRYELMSHKPTSDITLERYIINSELAIASLTEPWSEAQSVEKIIAVLNKYDDDITVVLSSKDHNAKDEIIRPDEAMISISTNQKINLISSLEKMNIKYRVIES